MFKRCYRHGTGTMRTSQNCVKSKVTKGNKPRFGECLSGEVRRISDPRDSMIRGK